MKRIKIMLVWIMCLLSISIVNAKGDTLDKFQNINTDATTISDIAGYKDGYILSEDIDGTNLYNYSSDNQTKGVKKISDLSKAKIINYSENFLIVGVSSNTLKVYLVNSDLKVLNQKQTSYFIQESSEINLYSYDNKVYVMLTYDDNLINSNIYEINNELEVKENKFSSYKTEILKSILKSDYYLIHFNDKEENDVKRHYNSSAYLDSQSILAGSISNVRYDELTENDRVSIISIFDDNGTKIAEKINEEYSYFKDVLSVNDKIVTLGKNKLNGNTLLILDKMGNVLETITLDSDSDNLNLKRVLNKVMIVNENKIISSTFLVNIYKEEDIYGSIKLPDLANPYDVVELSVIPNSGYKVKEILVTDREGNKINVVDSHFIMPSNDVYVKVNYEELVENPETLDIITIAIVFLCILIPISIYLYKKMAWLR